MTGFAVCATDARFPQYPFTGKERDAESGLDNFGARYFGSSMGRFMSPDYFDGDPVPFADFRNPQSLNLYAYAGNNPISNTDDDGHDYNLLGGNQCGQNSVQCDQQGYVLNAAGSRAVVTDAQVASGQYGSTSGANGVDTITTGQGTFSAQFFDASPNTVSATVYADPRIASSSMDFIQQVNAQNQAAMPLLNVLALNAEIAGGALAPAAHLAYSAASLAANHNHAQVAAGFIPKKPGTLGQHGSTEAELKFAKAVARATGADRGKVHALLQEASQYEDGAMSFSDAVAYVKAALSIP